MLCPNCGTDVGDKMTLCPSCAAKSGTGSGGASIGAIRPNVKIVRLKPEERRPDEEPPPVEPRTQTPPNESAAERPRHEPRQHEPRDSDPLPPSQPLRRQTDFAKVAGFFLVVSAAWALVVLLRSAWEKPLDFRPALEEEPKTFSHIVIHEKKEIVVDGISVVGVFKIDDLQIPLARTKALFNPSKHSLELQFFVPADFKEITLKPDEPAVKIHLQFSPLKGQLDRERLQSYMIEYLGGKEPLRVVKSFSLQLAAFGEVAPFSGGLKAGDKVRGAFRDSRTEEREGKVYHLNWELTFDTPLEIRR